MCAPIKPVILLAFANDVERPLLKLRDEERGLRQILEQAAAQPLSDGRIGLCELVTLSRATISDILTTFQKYRNRVAVFHYAGHANGYALLLESATGEPAIANADGLAGFLAQQTGLELVFLNGCATQQQAKGLLDAGVAVVIATAQEIKDTVATDFSLRFYQGLVSNAPIATAFKEAESNIVTAYGDNVRHLYATAATRRKKKPLPVGSPWELFYQADQQEIITTWTLGQLVNDPLFGLPPLPDLPLPPEPYRQLDYFRREHAHIFFGRGQQIRDLYTVIEAQEDDSILLLYGQSGIGKSSFLAAGLLPRLERDYQVAYCRRDQRKGLVGALSEVFSWKEPTQPFIECWHQHEVATAKPFIVVLDQIEELYTRPNAANPHEMKLFLDELQALFGEDCQRPRGKLILGFRKEWLAELTKLLRERNLPFNELFLERLDRRGITEAVAGVARVARLQRRYHLQVVEGLPEEIADDLLADHGSAIATTLQILLTKLWERAKTLSYEKPTFDQPLYHALRRNGLLLSDFLDQQLQTLHAIQPEVTDSGLVLDLLALHTTAQNTADECTLAHLLAVYHHRTAVLPTLVRQCQDLYLLTDPAANQPDQAPTSRLAHDTLAPLVQHRFDISDLPGQRAWRILETRCEEWKDGREGTPLDRRDLSLVEQGALGMRAWGKEAIRLVEASRRARTREQRIRNLIVTAFIAALVVMSVFWQASQSETIARAKEELNRLAEQALLHLSSDPLVSIYLSRNALPNQSRHRPYVPKAEFALYKALHANLERTYLPVSGSGLTAQRVAFGKIRIAIAEGKAIYLVNYMLDATQVVTHPEAISALSWRADGQRLVSYDPHNLRVWRDGEQITALTVPASEKIACAEWQPTGEQIALCQGNTLYLWSPTTQISTTVQTFTKTVTAALWSLDGQALAAWDRGSSLVIWDAQQEKILRFKATAHEKTIRTPAWSPDHQHLVTVSSDGVVHSWATSDAGQDQVIAHSKALYGAKFVNNEQFVTWGWADDTARLWSVDGKPLRMFGSAADTVQDVMLDEQGRLLTFLDDGDVQLWSVQTGERLALFRGHAQRVQHVAWRNNSLATASADGTGRVWQVDTTQQGISGALRVKDNPIILHGNTTTPGDAANDLLAVRWQDDQHLLTVGQDGSLRRWQVYDERGLPLCSGMDGDGYPRCFNQSHVLARSDGPLVTARWVDSTTVVATDRTQLISATVAGAQPYILPLAALQGRSPEVVWSPDGRRAFTYFEALTNTVGVFYNLQNHTMTAQISETIDAAFWLEAGLLLSRPKRQPLLFDPLAATAILTVSTQVCPPENPCAITAAAFHKDRARLALSDEQGMLYIQEVEGKKSLIQFAPTSCAEAQSTPQATEAIDLELPVQDLYWFADGKRLLAVGREITLWHVDEARVLWCYMDVLVTPHIALSPQEQMVAITSDKAIAVVNTATRELLWQRQLHNQKILGLQWLCGTAWPYQRYATVFGIDRLLAWFEPQECKRGERLLLLTWSGDGTARVWDWEGRDEVLRLTSTGNDDPINVAAVNSNGSALLTATQQGVLRVWSIWLQKPEQLTDLSEVRALSEQQKAAFPLLSSVTP